MLARSSNRQKSAYRWSAPGHRLINHKRPFRSNERPQQCQQRPTAVCAPVAQRVQPHRQLREAIGEIRPSPKALVPSRFLAATWHPQIFHFAARRMRETQGVSEKCKMGLTQNAEPRTHQCYQQPRRKQANTESQAGRRHLAGSTGLQLESSALDRCLVRARAPACPGT